MVYSLDQPQIHKSVSGRLFWNLSLGVAKQRFNTSENSTAGGSGSVVEHLLAKERVVGSNPIFRSSFNCNPLLLERSSR